MAISVDISHCVVVILFSYIIIIIISIIINDNLYSTVCTRSTSRALSLESTKNMIVTIYRQ